MMCGTMILNVASFYPLYVETHYPEEISSVMVASALSCFQVAGVIFTPIHSITISKMGRKNSIIIGFICIFITNTALGALSLIPDADWRLFYSLSCLIRFVQGYGDSLTLATSFSLIASQFSD